MKILGLNGSDRKLGNTEILVKEALRGAEEEGAQVEILKLTDYIISPCDGLALCVFGNKRCTLKDDLNFILDKIFESDGVVLGAPCYILESTAIIKQIIDRVFSINYGSPAKGKPAAIIVPFGTRGWTPYAMLQPNILTHFLGMNVIDRALIHTQVIGEAVMHKKGMLRARAMGKAVAMAVKTGGLATSYQGEPGICPICHDRLLRVFRDDETVECGLCGIRGKLTLENGKIKVHWQEDAMTKQRFSEENKLRHWTYHIKVSKDWFVKIKDLIKEGKKEFSEYLNADKQ